MEAGTSKMKLLADWIPSDFLACRWLPSCVFIGQREKEWIPGVSSYKNTNPILDQGLNSMTWFNYNYPYCSVGKESTCNAGDLRLSPRSGKSPGGGIGYPLQYFWASLGAQLIKTLPAMRETWIWSLGWEDPLEKEKATHFSILAWRLSWTV